MPLTLQTRERNNVTIIDIKGVMCLDTVRPFREKISELISSGKRKILLNMAGVRTTDSAGIGELISAFTTVTGAQGNLKILAFQKRVDDILRVTKLYTVFDVHNDEDAAVRSFHD